MKHSRMTSTQQILSHAGDDHLENNNYRDNEQAQKIYISSHSVGVESYRDRTCIRSNTKGGER